jgi:hypothetical protein
VRYALAGVLVLVAAAAARADDSAAEGGPDLATELAVHDFASLAPELAMRMNGARALFRVETAGPWRGDGQFRRCELAVADGRVFGEMFLPAAAPAPEGKMTVRATLVVHRGGSGYWYYLQRVEKQP